MALSTLATFTRRKITVDFLILQAASTELLYAGDQRAGKPALNAMLAGINLASILALVQTNLTDPLPSPLKIIPMLQCYSCMSLVAKSIFQDIPKHVNDLYVRPKNFSHACDHLTMNMENIPIKNCTDFCISVILRKEVMLGRYTDLQIRGCLSDIKNYNATLYRTFIAYPDKCRWLRKKDLFSRGFFQSMKIADGDAYFCSCQGHRCNGAARTHLPVLQWTNFCNLRTGTIQWLRLCCSAILAIVLSFAQYR